MAGITTDMYQARTPGGTPLHTPQLFSPSIPNYPARTESYAGSSTVSSPYLHPSQTQPVKETHKALRDIGMSGRKTVNQYELFAEIGNGAHGKVKLARSQETGEVVAIKIVQRFSKKRRLGKSQVQEDKVKKEVAILKKTIHPNVVSMIEVIDDSDLHKVYLVLEFCDAHDLKWRIPGSHDIVILEHRRVQREMRGEPEIDPTTSSDELLREVVRRTQNLEEHQPPPVSRTHSATAWSLEHGESSEHDTDDFTRSASVAGSSTSRPESAPPRAELPSTDAEHTTGEQSTKSRSQGEKSSSQATPPGLDTVVDAHAAQDSSLPMDLAEFQAEFGRRLADFEENLQQHGADSRGRTMNKNDRKIQTRKQLAQIVESEIDEELRWVPSRTMNDTRRAFRDATLGLEYLHYQGIVHRDIKPENLLTKSNFGVKISDFSVSYLGKPIRDGKDSEETSETESPDHEEEAELAKTVGTPAFYAPELCSLDFTSERPRVTGQIDVWALGVTLYVLVYARLPFIANNEFVIMRRIAEDDIFFSRKRLRALNPHSSRASSHGRHVRASREHRFSHELLYEDVEDDLIDLMRRLLEKDPEKRITIKEIKHHPWVLQDIENPTEWLEETDPARFAEGKKIEISKEEVADAVIPLRLIERAKSVAKKVGGVLGLGTGIRSTRKRGASSTNSSDTGSASPGASVHSAASLKGDRTEILRHVDQSQTGSMGPPPSQDHTAQLHHHDQSDHPLSQSVSASPGSTAEDEPFDEAFSAANAGRPLEGARPTTHPQRPSMPDRQTSVMSATGSIRTLRQSDMPRTSPDHPSSPDNSSDAAGTSALGTLFGTAGMNIMSRMRSQDRQGVEGRTSGNEASTDDATSDNLHGEPSVAVSSMSASGRVQGPGSGGRYSGRRNSAFGPVNDGSVQSATLSAITEANLALHSDPYNQANTSHQSSTASLADPEPVVQYPFRNVNPLRERPTAATGSRSDSQSSDDEEGPRHVRFGAGSRGDSNRVNDQRSEPHSERKIALPNSSNSSTDRFHDDMSQSTSFPSMPSVVSANSSVHPDEKGPGYRQSHNSARPSGKPLTDRSAIETADTRTPHTMTSDSEGNHSSTPDVVIETDEDDSEDEGDFLVMNRKNPRPAPSSSTSKSSTPAARHKTRKAHPRKTSRSGSSTTVKKVLSREDSGATEIAEGESPAVPQTVSPEQRG